MKRNRMNNKNKPHRKVHCYKCGTIRDLDAKETFVNAPASNSRSIVYFCQKCGYKD